MCSARGQATIDYIALVGVVAVVFSAALAFATGGAPGIVNAVASQIRYALCVVGGGICSDPRARPCTVASTRDGHHVAVGVAIVRVDHDSYVLRERMSDGTVRLTIAGSSGAGVELGLGGSIKAALRGHDVGVATEARAGVEGVLGSGRVFVARDDREADAFLRALDGEGEQRPAPREVFVEGGVRGLGRIGIGRGVAGVSLDGLMSALIGARRDRRTGALTFTLDSGSSGWGAATIALGGPVGLADRTATLELTLDSSHHPSELSLATGGTIAGGMALPPTLARMLGGERTAPTSAAGRRWELGARLDLHDPEVAATWARFRRDPTSSDAIAALGAAMRDRAQLDLRTYRAESSSSGAGAGLGLGVRLGGEFDHTIDRSRLLAASSRPPGGLWEPRLDCVPA